MVCLSHLGESPAKSLTLEMGLPPTLLPGQSLFFTYNYRKKENPNNYHIPGSVARASRGGEGGWRDIRVLVQFPDRGGSRGTEFRYPGLRS